ncbi:transposase [Streptomyces sp. NBC_01217]|uniref:transposase n=1 Tax=Streptomyces sp. NBC_01217 TaxID=2903779 RepID=UPI002E0DB84D|nr:transposase [Streptomyces sp. NBC_01217]
MNVRLSRSTVLTQLMPLPPLVTPRVLEVDDFALYGDTYGTRLVDHTTRLPVTLWEGRDAEQLSRWLRTHPGIEIACRDGSLTYRQGIAGGAPDAIQVSDRFHLWQGLSRRVQEVAATHRGFLPAALPAPEQGASQPSFDDNGSRAGHFRQPARPTALRGRPCTDRCQPPIQRRSPRTWTGPSHRPQIRAGPYLARGGSPLAAGCCFVGAAGRLFVAPS